MVALHSTTVSNQVVTGLLDGTGASHIVAPVGRVHTILQDGYISSCRDHIQTWDFKKANLSH